MTGEPRSTVFMKACCKVFGNRCCRLLFLKTAFNVILVKQPQLSGVCGFKYLAAKSLCHNSCRRRCNGDFVITLSPKQQYFRDFHLAASSVVIASFEAVIVVSYLALLCGLFVEWRRLVRRNCAISRASCI
ncbi:Hypothetical_protein [Hexamita inflata]|uniref:Hypothetical_protein n=1 Tax=Hexamita inflata TaxID=28002 RepID=A0AA86R4R9_9EUKA|nr:Hypothetical protein HINF_LOCUS52020 [Hexamita inflata]CAI9967071.1 Hypothetical protein HINF_LOCUS54716 [Hexamita inflata]